MKDDTVLICLGANIDPRTNLPRALKLLAERLDLLAVSSLYASPARGAPGSPPFLNAAVAAVGGLEPAALKFDVLRAIEAEMGRVRTADRNAPRPIDLDLAIYGDRVVDDPEAGLEVPDPEILKSPHVALPLAEIAGSMRHPVRGETLEEIARPMRDRADIRIVAPPPDLGRRA